MTQVMDAGLALRPYQTEAIDLIDQAEHRGSRRQLGVAATGLGKTVMFVELAKQRGGRTLILVHRDELVRQAYRKVRQQWPSVDVGIVKAADNDVAAHVVIASVQTLSRPKRLQNLLDSMTSALLRSDPFDLVVVDEAHHATADSYQRVLTGVHAGEPDGPLLLGVTATPDRGDGEGLHGTFNEIVWNYDILWGIRAGYLCEVRGQRVKVSDLDLSTVKVSRGDYEQGAVGTAMMHSHTADRVVQAWLEHAADRRTLVFTPTVEVSQEIEAVFAGVGVACAHIDGTTPIEDRRRILADYTAGNVQVITNCAVLTEGYDEPRTDCIVQARPTKSRGLFTQMVGRGTRKHPDKTDLLVLDIIGSTDEHSLIGIPSLLGIPAKFTRTLTDGTGLLSRVAQDYDDHLVQVGLMTIEDADLFRVMRGEGIAWVQVHRSPEEPKRYERPCGDGLPTVVVTEGLGDWLCGLLYPDGKKEVLIGNVDLETAQNVGEDAVRKLTQGRSALTDLGAPWRRGKPTKKQIGAAHRWGVEDVKSYRTAGELSDAISARSAQVRNERARARRDQAS